MPHAPKSLKSYRTKRAPDARPNSNQRGYTHRWAEASTAWLLAQFAAGNVRCAACGGLLDGERRDTHVDHKIPHRGSQELFWDQSNWQALHASCHSRKTARESGGQR